MDIITLIMVGFVAIALPIMVAAVFKRNTSPALLHKSRMDKIVRSIPDAQAFYAALAKEQQMPSAAKRAPGKLAVVKYVGLDQAGYPHRCEYCGNPLYITDKSCGGCGAPRK